MKKILAVALAVAANVASAAEPVSCDVIGKMAEFTMQMRQIGLPASKAIQTINEKITNDAERDFLVKMTLKAYEHPQFHSDSIRQRTSVEFGSQYFIACLRSKM